MNKKLISLAIFVSIFCLAGFVSAQTITNPLGATSDFPTLLIHIAAYVGTLVAILGTIKLIVAGIFFLTSAGDPGRIGVAKKAMAYAIVGIAIGVAASSIATEVISIMSGT